MLCKKPFGNFRCGRCTPCRIRHRLSWTLRIVLESLYHPHNSFATLTFSDENLLKRARPESLDVRDVQLFMKRLRKQFGQPVRYFAVGEYGDISSRPHYHLALFGYPSCQLLRTQLDKNHKPICCENCKLISEVWPYGRIDNGTLERESAQYIASYTVKKWTNASDPYTLEKLNGRSPEFARMSLKPGIGHGLIEDVSNRLEEFEGNLMLHFGTRTKIGVGKYLNRKLGEKFYGENWKILQKDKISKDKAALQDLFTKELDEILKEPESIQKRNKITNQYSKIKNERLQAVKNLEAKIKIREADKHEKKRI